MTNCSRNPSKNAHNLHLVRQWGALWSQNAPQYGPNWLLLSSWGHPKAPKVSENTISKRAQKTEAEKERKSVKNKPVSAREREARSNM